MYFLYDLDGTLCYTDDAYKAAFIDMGFTEKDYFNIKGHSDISACEILGVSDVDSFTLRKEASFRKFVHLIKSVPGATQFVKQTHPYAIITNGNYEASLAIIRHMGLTPVFVIAANAKIFPKPSPEPYLKAIEMMGATKSECVIVEDSPVGLQSARASKAFTLAFSKTDVQCDLRFTNWFDLQLTNVRVKLIEKQISELTNRRCTLSDKKLKGGFICNVHNVEIDDEQFVLKVKADNQHTITREATSLDLFQREFKFYASIRSLIQVPENVPECLWCGIVAGCEGLILRNISDENTSILKYFTHEILDNVVDTLVKIQSTDVSSHKIHMPSDVLFSSWNEICAQRFSKFSSIWYDVVGPETLYALNIAIANMDKIRSALSSNNSVLCHGDYKAANMFYNNIKNHLYILDWQYIMKADGVTDICFFAVESLQNILHVEHVRQRYMTYTGMEEFLFQRSWHFSMLFFPLYVALWFGTLDKEDLIDVSFPDIFIRNYVQLILKYDTLKFIHQEFLPSPPPVSFSVVNGLPIPPGIERLYISVKDGCYCHNTEFPKMDTSFPYDNFSIDVHCMVNDVDFWIDRAYQVYKHIDTLTFDAMNLTQFKFEKISHKIRQHKTKVLIQITHDIETRELFSDKPWLLNADGIFLVGDKYESHDLVKKIGSIFNKFIMVDEDMDATGFFINAIVRRTTK